MWLVDFCVLATTTIIDSTDSELVGHALVHVGKGNLPSWDQVVGGDLPVTPWQQFALDLVT